MAPDSSRNRLPFEPGGKRKGEVEKASKAAKPATEASSSTKSTKSKPAKATRAKQAAIPEVVSQRMFRRMLIFSGVPTFLGVTVFFVSYFLLINEVLEFPRYFVLFATLGCFGLGVVGLSYGALSASWDESRLGHWLGMEEFKVNFGRLTGAWGSRADS